MRYLVKCFGEIQVHHIHAVAVVRRLGPALFKIHINDIDRIVELITLLLKFADDTKLAQLIRGEEDRRRLQEAVARGARRLDGVGRQMGHGL